MKRNNHYLNKKNMKTKIILDIPKGKSIKDCHLSKIEVLDKEGNTIKTITEGIKPLKIKR